MITLATRLAEKEDRMRPRIMAEENISTALQKTAKQSKKKTKSRSFTDKNDDPWQKARRLRTKLEGENDLKLDEKHMGPLQGSCILEKDNSSRKLESSKLPRVSDSGIVKEEMSADTPHEIQSPCTLPCDFSPDQRSEGTLKNSSGRGRKKKAKNNLENTSDASSLSPLLQSSKSPAPSGVPYPPMFPISQHKSRSRHNKGERRRLSHVDTVESIANNRSECAESTDVTSSPSQISSLKSSAVSDEESLPTSIQALQKVKRRSKFSSATPISPVTSIIRPKLESSSSVLDVTVKTTDKRKTKISIPKVNPEMISSIPSMFWSGFRDVPKSTNVKRKLKSAPVTSEAWPLSLGSSTELVKSDVPGQPTLTKSKQLAKKKTVNASLSTSSNKLDFGTKKSTTQKSPKMPSESKRNSLPLNNRASKNKATPCEGMGMKYSSPASPVESKMSGSDLESTGDDAGLSSSKRTDMSMVQEYQSPRTRIRLSILGMVDAAISEEFSSISTGSVGSKMVDNTASTLESSQRFSTAGVKSKQKGERKSRTKESEDKIDLALLIGENEKGDERLKLKPRRRRSKGMALPSKLPFSEEVTGELGTSSASEVPYAQMDPVVSCVTHRSTPFVSHTIEKAKDNKSPVSSFLGTNSYVPTLASRREQIASDFPNKKNFDHRPRRESRSPQKIARNDILGKCSSPKNCKDSTSVDTTPSRQSKIKGSLNYEHEFLKALAAPTTPIRRDKAITADPKTCHTAKKKSLAINPSSSRVSSKSKSPTPPLRCMDTSHHGKEKAKTYADSALTLLCDPTKRKHVLRLIDKIELLGGFPRTRRLSLRDNELVGQFVKAIRNDNTVTEIQVDPILFGTISSTLLNQFMHALRINLHINTLYLEGVELGNDFLYALATSMESNFVIQDINLSQNLFTSEGLANFCISLATNNNSVRSLNLASQTTPISEASEADVLAAFDQNTTLTFVDVDFVTEEGKTRLASILERNRKLAAKTTIDAAKNVDDKLIEVLTFEAERAQEAWDQRAEEENIKDIDEEDWEYLYQLSLLFDKHKLKKEVEQNTAMGTGIDPTTRRKNADDLNREEKKEFLFGAFQKTMEESFMAFKEDGSFLTSEFISKYLLERTDADEEGIGLDFDFHGQWKLFKRFPPHDPARKLIVDKFVDAIVSHPRANELTGINMANTGMGDDFAIALSARCLKDSSLLPNLHTVNFETNYVNEVGVVALSQLVAARDCCKYIQVIRLENQKDMLKSKAEFALAKALRVNRSVVVVSLTMRNLLEKERMVKYIMRNVDLLRQARQQHMKNIGTQRKRNKVEAFFDKILQNDPAITKVDMGGNERFLTLTKTEKIRAAASFAHNTHVIDVVLNGCGIDDDFAKALGEAMKTNLSIERLHLESNDISGEGIKALFHGLGDNCNLRELRLHNQSKVLASVDEDLLAGLLEENTTLTKVGVDLRSMLARNKLDRKVAMNKNFEFKMKAAAKGDEFISNESYSFIRF